MYVIFGNQSLKSSLKIFLNCFQKYSEFQLKKSDMQYESINSKIHLKVLKRWFFAFIYRVDTLNLIQYSKNYTNASLLFFLQKLARKVTVKLMCWQNDCLKSVFLGLGNLSKNSSTATDCDSEIFLQKLFSLILKNKTTKTYSNCLTGRVSYQINMCCIVEKYLRNAAEGVPLFLVNIKISKVDGAAITVTSPHSLATIMANILLWNTCCPSLNFSSSK